MFGEYPEAEQKKRRELETAARGVLHQLRISGSAIGGVNPEVVPEWKNELDKIAQPYRERLDDMKARLEQPERSAGEISCRGFGGVPRFSPSPKSGGQGVEMKITKEVQWK